MAIRATMENLVERTKRLIAEVTDCDVFTDDEIQASLDKRRLYVRYKRLRPLVTLENSQIKYYDFVSADKDFETDYKITDSIGTETAPDSADLINGYFTYNAAQDQIRYITGKSYDPYGSAADLLIQRAVSRSNRFDFYDGTISIKRSQEFENLIKAAKEYRRKARVIEAVMVRDDV